MAVTNDQPQSSNINRNKSHAIASYSHAALVGIASLPHIAIHTTRLLFAKHIKTIREGEASFKIGLCWTAKRVNRSPESPHTDLPIEVLVNIYCTLEQWWRRNLPSDQSKSAISMSTSHNMHLVQRAPQFKLVSPAILLLYIFHQLIDDIQISVINRP